MTPNLNLRNATLEDLANLLTEQNAAKLDAVVPAAAIRSVGGVLRVEGLGGVLTPEGVSPAPADFRPTPVAVEHLADKLKVPLAYMRRMGADRPDLFDANVNGWLHGTPDRAVDGEDGMVHHVPGSGPDDRKFLLRAFRGGEGPGIARAVLSRRFGGYDHLDLLVATLDGVHQAGVDVVVDGCDLTERRMRVRVACPQVATLAPALLEGYRSPFPGGWDLNRAREAARRENSGYGPGSEPVLWAGFEIGNSETGGGQWYVAPRAVVQICGNGLKFEVGAEKRRHVGGHLEEGLVEWSNDTHCQPPGTMVMVPDGGWQRGGGTGGAQSIQTRYVPIESLREGDLVISHAASRLVMQGRRVLSIGSVPFSGRLVTVTTPNGKMSRYTPNHRCIARLAPAIEGKHLVYLMRSGNSFRVGRTSDRRKTANGNLGRQSGLATRLREEGADAAWILSVHDSAAEALAAEGYTSWRFGIPQQRFRSTGHERDQFSHRSTQEALDTFWLKVGDLTDSATACLAAHDRDVRFPLAERGRWTNYARQAEVRACNLLDGAELVDADATRAAWKRRVSQYNVYVPVRVRSEFYEGPVWSMDVEQEQTYVADGLVTHNSRALELITARARDAVATFVSREFLEAQVRELEVHAGKPLDRPAEAVEVVTKRLKVSEAHAATVLDHFIKGGKATAGGVLNAFTSASQTVADPDEAAELEALGIEAMRLAAEVRVGVA